MVRGLTLYEDTADELPSSTLDTLVKTAKMRLQNKYGSDSFYSDSGLGQALVGATAIIAKSAVENYSVDRWDVGEGDIDVSGAGDADQVQFQQWARLTAEGVTSSDAVSDDSASPTGINSSPYIG